MLSRRDFLTASGGLIIGLSATPTLLAQSKITKLPIYSGWVPNKRLTQAFKTHYQVPMFAQAGQNLAGSGEGKKALLWKFFEQVSGPFVPHNQTIGDCVSMGYGLGVDFLDAIQIAHGKGSWVAKAATEVIYAGGRVEIGDGRIHGDGMHGSLAARWCNEYGVLLRQPYLDGKYDFTTYSGSKARKWAHKCKRCTDWGGGVPDELEPLAKKHPVKTVTLITSWEQARDALYNGYPISVCSNKGFNSDRDSEGFAKNNTTWYHCLGKDTMVPTSEGILKISKTHVNDMIISKTGWHRIDGIRHSTQEALEIGIVGNLPIIATPNHKFLVSRISKVSGKPVTRRRYELSLKTGKDSTQVIPVYESRTSQWITTNELEPGDWLLTPLHFNKSKLEHNWDVDDRDLLWLLGLLAADGHCTKDGHKVTLVGNISELAQIQKARIIFEQMGYEPRLKKVPNKNAVRLSVFNSNLSRKLRKYLYDGDVKKYPSWAIGDRHFISGLWCGDGSKTNTSLTFANTSESLAQGLHLSLTLLGFIPSISKTIRKTPHRDLFQVLWNQSGKYTEGWNDDNFVYRKIKYIEKVGEKEVYDISVDSPDRSFVANNILTHNCMLLAGMDDSSSRPGGLFINSWGSDWIEGPTRLDQPVGSFWADADIIDKMLKQEDSFALSNYVGYPSQDLDYNIF